MSKVGCVVIGRNEGQRLGLSVASALADTPNVVYVDSASTDDSVEVAQRLGASVLRLHDQEPFTAARARAWGLKTLMSLAPDCVYVQFLDGDCILQPGWVEKARALLDHDPKAAVVCGRRFEAHPDASLYNRTIDAEWNTPVGQAEACGGDALMRVAAFRRAGTFKSHLKAGEEPELCARFRQNGWTIWRIDAPMTEHDAHILDLRTWLRRTERGGFGYAQVWNETRRTATPLYGRQLVSTLIWPLAVPAFFLLLAAVSGHWWLLLGIPALYLLQTLRIARRLGLRPAAMLMLMKFAELKGALRYWLAGEVKQTTSYKNIIVKTA